jgi:hypothetical protein
MAMATTAGDADHHLPPPGDRGEAPRALHGLADEAEVVHRALVQIERRILLWPAERDVLRHGARMMRRFPAHVKCFVL